MHEFKNVMAAADMLVALWIGCIAFGEYRKRKSISVLVILIFLFLASTVAIMR